MNLIDLPELMRQRSDDPTPVLTESRLEGVHHKVVIARRRRVAGGLAVVAAVVVAGLVIGLPSVHHVAKVPATKQTIGGFPAYAEGGHVVGVATGDLRGGPVTVTFVPDRLDFAYTNVCSAASMKMSIMMDVAVDGHSITSFSCTDTAGGAYASNDPALWSTLGAAVGKPITFTFTPTKASAVTISGNDHETDVTVPMPAGTFSVAVLQKLPFTKYPLPPRPKKLPALDVLHDFNLVGSAPKIIDSDPADPLKPISYSFTFPDCGKASPGMCLEASLASQTPGFLAISINGKQYGTAEFWDYSAGGYSFELDPTMDKISLHTGETVTVTVTPQYVTGAWQFGISTKPVPR